MAPLPTLRERILSDIEGRINSREWPPGAHIPFEPELAQQYSCSRITVNTALAARRYSHQPRVFESAHLAISRTYTTFRVRLQFSTRRKSFFAQRLRNWLSAFQTAAGDHIGAQNSHERLSTPFETMHFFPALTLPQAWVFAKRKFSKSFDAASTRVRRLTHNFVEPDTRFCYYFQ